MRMKLGVLFLLAVIVIASAGMGISYANGDLNTSGEICCDVAFTSASASDNEFEEGVVDPKDVGAVEVDPSGNDIYTKSLVVYITNAYPGYKAYIDFTITNMGNKPIDVLGVVSKDYNNTALRIVVTGVVAGGVLYPSRSLDGTVTIKVRQGAKQNTLYPFTVGFGFSSEECNNNLP